MTPRAAIGTLALVAAAALTACGGGSATSTTSATTATSSSTAGSAAAPTGATASSTPTGAATTPTQRGTSAGTGTPGATGSTSQGIAVGEPNPGSPTTRHGTKADAGIPPAPTATVDLAAFCGSLAAAHYHASDLSDLRTTTAKATVDEVVDRLDRLSDVTPPSTLAKDWRATLDAFDHIASKASQSSDAQVPGIIRAELGASAAARGRVMAAAQPCR